MAVNKCKKCGSVISDGPCLVCLTRKTEQSKLYCELCGDPMVIFGNGDLSCEKCGLSVPAGTHSGQSPLHNPIGSVLTEAHQIINGPRRSAYGHPKESFEDIATAWSLQLKRQLTSPIKPRQVAMMMAMLKILRDRSKPGRDNAVDLCGYGALAEDVDPA